ncbi:hypothetical protein ACS0TY_018223 [Phlomoides rotata]
MAAWPGRLTLTNYALYFEPGVGLYDKAVRYDLATEMKQVIKLELTGPLGTRLFDKAVMYKSTSMLLGSGELQNIFGLYRYVDTDKLHIHGKQQASCT